MPVYFIISRQKSMPLTSKVPWWIMEVEQQISDVIIEALKYQQPVDKT